MPAAEPSVPRHARSVEPADVAGRLGRNDIHLWWLPYRRAAGRQPLLDLLAAYLGTDACELELRAGTHGRPALTPPRELDFNWSHSGPRAVVALARGPLRLGVDVECPRTRRRTLDLARRFFAATEYARLRTLPESQREAAFLRLWTAKEAVLKAHGQGLSYGLDRVAFTLHGSRPHPDSFHGDVGDAADWHLRHWSLPGGYASLAWHGDPRRVHHFVPEHITGP